MKRKLFYMKVIVGQWVSLLLLLACSNVNASNKIGDEVKDRLKQQLAIFNLALGDEVLLRLFKKEAVVELWMKPQGKTQYISFKNYPICKYSGGLGPKVKQGDKQAPEGFYQVTQNRMNPNSSFHLSFNLGYPNQFDQYHGRTGDYLMIHGSCVSTGCYAMGNTQIEELYYILSQAFAAGQQAVNVHAYPFKLETATLEQYKSNQWYDFWQQLKPGYDYFNKTKTDLKVEVVEGKYVISP